MVVVRSALKKNFILFCFLLLFSIVATSEISLVLAKKLADKNVSKMTYIVSSGM